MTNECAGLKDQSWGDLHFDPASGPGTSVVRGCVSAL